MRLALLTFASLLCFAGNSLINRLAVAEGAIGPVDFAVIRVVTGAAVLAVLISVRRAWVRPVWRDAAAAAGLSVYLYAFSLAYLAIPAGPGALVLFAAVQVGMFAGALALREAVPARRWLGAGAALGGLAVMALPGAGAVAFAPAAVMALAGFGWAAFSLAGRGAPAPLAAITLAFLLSLIPAGPVGLAFGEGGATAPGAALAVLSGAVTSGLGYILWYTALPLLGAARAGVVQASTPVLVALGGVVLLAEPVTPRLVLAAVVVTGGVAWAMAPARRLSGGGSGRP